MQGTTTQSPTTRLDPADVAELTTGLGCPRPTRSDAARNYDALLAAGREAFAEHGSSASLEDIARRAGVGIGTLYRNFPTRDDLIETLYVDEVERIAAVATEVAELEPWAAVEAWLDRFVEYVGTKHALIDALNRESTVFAQCRAVLYSSAEPVIDRAQLAGELRADVGVSDVIRLVAGVAGVSGYEDDAQRRRVLDIAIAGLRPQR